ncbi:MAG: hypothetical protein ABH885_00245 [Candidatus Omnitrophota bacterium]
MAAAVGMYYLCRYVTCDNNAAFFSGLCYALMPLNISSIHNGTDEALSLCWIPLYFLNLLKVLNTGSICNLILSMVFLFLASLGCFYFGFSLVIATLLLLGYTVFIRNEFQNKQKASIVARGFIILCVSSCLCLPFFVRLMKSSHISDRNRHILGVNQMIRRPDIVGLNCTNLKNYFKTYSFQGKNAGRIFCIRPRHFQTAGLLDNIAYRKTDELRASDPDPFNDFAVYTIYIGYIALGFGVWGVISRKRGFLKFYWAICCLFFFLLSVGNSVYWGSREIGVPFLRYILPYNILGMLFSFICFAILTHRFGAVMYLGLFILAGTGLRDLLNTIGLRQRSLYAVLFSLLAVTEYLLISPVPYPLDYADARVPDYVTKLGDVPGRAVIEVPFRDVMKCMPVSGLYYQIYHGKDVIYGVNSNNSMPASLEDNYFLGCLRKVSSSGLVLPDWRTADEKTLFIRNRQFVERVPKGAFIEGSAVCDRMKAAIQELTDLLFSGIILYKYPLCEEAEKELSFFLRFYLGAPVWESREAAIYRLGG